MIGQHAPTAVPRVAVALAATAVRDQAAAQVRVRDREADPAAAAALAVCSVAEPVWEPEPPRTGFPHRS